MSERQRSRRHSRGVAFPHSIGTLIAPFVLAAIYFGISERAWCAPVPKKIVLIGGLKSHGVGEHDFPNGVRHLRDILNSSPDVRAIEALTIEAYPDAWPDNDQAFNSAATIVWYFDGLDQHPLLNEQRRVIFSRLMRQGVGLVALHQASTVPQEDKKIPLGQWLGAARYGLFDRTTETIRFTPKPHPISRGVAPFVYTDEFYPTLKFFGIDGRITPILVGKFHVQFREGQKQIAEKPIVAPAAWAFERDDSGRAFGFTGLHYVENLDQPQFRKLLLNAILWTAHIEVPADGTRSGFPGDAKSALERESAGPEKIDPPKSVEAENAQRNGEEIYRQRCSPCHDHPQDRIPPKDLLSTRTTEYIVTALTTGVMKSQATGLSPPEITRIAAYLSSLGASSKQDVLERPSLQANLCRKTPKKMQLSSDDWNGWSPDLENSRFQASSTLTVSDIPKLKPRWVFAYPGTLAYGSPSVVSGRVFITTTTGSVLSIDEKTGCTLWATAPGSPVKTAVSVGAWPASVEVNGLHPRFAAYYGDAEGLVHAVDAETGAALWSKRVDEHPFAFVGESPKLYDGRLYVPIASREGMMGARGDYQCCTLRGSVSVLDAVTGALVWKAYPIAEEPKPFKLNRVGTQMYGPAGASIWSTPTIDVQRRVVYVGTGESRTDVRTDGADSVVAFDLLTGKRQWLMHALDGDNWTWGCDPPEPGPNCPDPVGPDADFGSPAILARARDGKRILFGAQKSGVVHALDPGAGGKVIWRRNLASETGIPPGVTLRDREQPGVVFGMAADQDRLYAAIADPSALRGHIPLGVYALRFSDGATIWHTPGPPVPSCGWGDKGCVGAQRTAVTVIPGAVFAGSADGHMRCYSADTGAVIWDFDTFRSYPAVNGVTAKGGAIEGASAVVSGRTLYVMSGYASYGGAVGDALIAFSVDGR